MLDILIKNGRYADFDEGRLARGDIGVKDGKITAVGEVDEPAKKVIDASGKIVSMGFVDIHMHEECFDEEEYDIALRMLRMGVTSCVAGNCGGQRQSVARFREAIESRGGAPVNYLLLAGYNAARHAVGGLARYAPADEATVERIAAHIKSEIEAGASGMSFGVEYDPAITEEEIIHAINAQERREIFVSMHYRGDDKDAIDSINEMIRIARSTGVRFQISHLSSCSATGQMEESLALINRAKAENPLLDYDTYPYNASCTSIGSACFDGDSFQERQAKNVEVLVVSGAHAGEICDRALFEELRANEPGTLVAAFSMREKEIRMAIENPYCGMVASDGILKRGNGHPRAAGTFARILAKYVREEGILSMMGALNKISAVPAARIGLSNKTRLAPGYDADIAVFDPEKVRDNATFMASNLPPEGFTAVIVNGALAIENDEVINARAGRFMQSLG